MSWSYHRKGSKRAILADIEKANVYYQSAENTSSWERAKVFIKAEVEAQPAPYVNVEAGGHAGSGNANVSVKVEALILTSEPAEG